MQAPASSPTWTKHPQPSPPRGWAELGSGADLLLYRGREQRAAQNQSVGSQLDSAE